MAELEPPTLGEVLRRLEQIAVQLANIASEMKQDRSDNAKTYVRRDIYLAQRQSDAAVVADLNGDIQSIKAERVREASQRRQLVMWVGGLTVTVLFAIAGLVVSVLTLVT